MSNIFSEFLRNIVTVLSLVRLMGNVNTSTFDSYSVNPVIVKRGMGSIITCPLVLNVCTKQIFNKKEGSDSNIPAGFATELSKQYITPLELIYAYIHRKTYALF